MGGLRSGGEGDRSTLPDPLLLLLVGPNTLKQELYLLNGKACVSQMIQDAGEPRRFS